MPEEFLDEFLTSAKEAAKLSGNVLLKWLGKRFSIEEKSENDFVTEVDRESEAKIKDFLRKRFPDVGFLGEETGTERSTEGSARWLIDPLDGTKNYIIAFPFFCVSVALEIEGNLVVGVVYDPTRDELFWTKKGKGAFKNDERIKVSERSDFSMCSIATGFPFKHREILDMYLESFRRIFLSVSAVRRAGSAALDLCYTACGIFDGFWEFGLSPWDVAAGGLILIEARGTITDFWGKDEWVRTGCVVGANPKIHPMLLKVTKDVFKFHHP